MTETIAITNTTFGKFDKKPLQMLYDQGFRVRLNPYGRKLQEEELIALTRDAIGAIAGTENWSTRVIEAVSNLRVISRCGVGIDNVNLEMAEKRGIKVYNTPDAPTQAVAELTVGLILALLRRVLFMDRNIRKGLWDKQMGNLLFGKKIGIIGFGRIGRRVAELLKAIGAEVSFFDPAVPEKEQGIFAKMEFNNLLKKSDIVSLHLSYSQENHKLIGKQELSLMQQGAFLINCSRGGIVDEEALYSALKEARLAGAAVDVFEQEPYRGPLRELDNVILTPHIGSYAREARIEMEMQAVENLLSGLKDRH